MKRWCLLKCWYVHNTYHHHLACRLLFIHSRRNFYYNRPCSITYPFTLHIASSHYIYRLKFSTRFTSVQTTWYPYNVSHTHVSQWFSQQVIYPISQRNVILAYPDPSISWLHSYLPALPFTPLPFNETFSCLLLWQAWTLRTSLKWFQVSTVHSDKHNSLFKLNK
jgi:hypothetical protein